MIRIDPRDGSGRNVHGLKLVDPQGGFLSPLRRLGAPCKIKQLTYGDFCFWGHGAEGRVRVGVERKTVSEWCEAIYDTRFKGHQLPGLLKRYPGHVWLVIEGFHNVDPQSGVMMQGKWSAGHGGRRTLYMDAMKFLFTLQLKAGVHIWPTRNALETAWFIRALYDWYQKRWKDHTSVYDVGAATPDVAILDTRTLKRRVAAQFPQIAWVRSKRVDQYFRSIASMLGASEEDWMAALGIREGRTIVRELRRSIYAEDEDTHPQGREARPALSRPRAQERAVAARRRRQS